MKKSLQYFFMQAEGQFPDFEGCSLSEVGNSRALFPKEVSRMMDATDNDIKIWPATIPTSIKVRSEVVGQRVVEYLANDTQNVALDRYALLLRGIHVVPDLQQVTGVIKPCNTLVLIWSTSERMLFIDSTREHLKARGFEHIDMLCMPRQGSLDVRPEYTSTRAMEFLLAQMCGCNLNPCWRAIAMVVDSYRMGQHESAHTVLAHASEKHILVSGYADWPDPNFQQWFGGSLVIYGREAFTKYAQLMQKESPATKDRPQYLDNWLQSKARNKELPVVLDVPRGGPHPRVTTTLLKGDGDAKMKIFGGGLSPNVNALSGEDVEAPSFIADWLKKLQSASTKCGGGRVGERWLRGVPIPQHLSPIEPAASHHGPHDCGPWHWDSQSQWVPSQLLVEERRTPNFYKELASMLPTQCACSRKHPDPDPYHNPPVVLERCMSEAKSLCCQWSQQDDEDCKLMQCIPSYSYYCFSMEDRNAYAMDDFPKVDTAAVLYAGGPGHGRHHLSSDSGGSTAWEGDQWQWRSGSGRDGSSGDQWRNTAWEGDQWRRSTAWKGDQWHSGSGSAHWEGDQRAATATSHGSNQLPVAPQPGRDKKRAHERIDDVLEEAQYHGGGGVGSGGGDGGDDSADGDGGSDGGSDGHGPLDVKDVEKLMLENSSTLVSDDLAGECLRRKLVAAQKKYIQAVDHAGAKEILQQTTGNSPFNAESRELMQAERDVLRAELNGQPTEQQSIGNDVRNRHLSRLGVKKKNMQNAIRRTRAELQFGTMLLEQGRFAKATLRNPAIRLMCGMRSPEPGTMVPPLPPEERRKREKERQVRRCLRRTDERIVFQLGKQSYVSGKRIGREEAWESMKDSLGQLGAHEQTAAFEQWWSRQLMTRVKFDPKSGQVLTTKDLLNVHPALQTPQQREDYFRQVMVPVEVHSYSLGHVSPEFWC